MIQYNVYESIKCIFFINSTIVMTFLILYFIYCMNFKKYSLNLLVQNVLIKLNI